MSDEPLHDAAVLGALPEDIRDMADRNYDLLNHDPRHPSLHFRQIEDLWSVRVGLHYRALAYERVEGLVWFWIGSHADYDQKIGR
jgi:hypothetical protein